MITKRRLSQNPIQPNPEQTASLLSMVTYSFLDPLVFLAYHVPHLAHDQLPPLADYDYIQNLKSASFKVRLLASSFFFLLLILLIAS